nr:alpha-L-arabinofuranosidase C-terminal domain-containing protein [uncultured Flavobacterium sp.]
MISIFKFKKQKNYFLGFLIFCLSSLTAFANNPDSAYIFSYSSGKSYDGLHFAWSTDKINWHTIGPEYSYIYSDYGSWGSEKRMVSPLLFPDADGLWHCLWGLNDKDGTFAHASSKDLLHWGRQSYSVVMINKNCLTPELCYNNEKREYSISWLSKDQTETKAWFNTTKDFKKFSETKNIPVSEHKNSHVTIKIDNKSEIGSINKVSWNLVEGLINIQQLSSYRNQLWAETSQTDNERFASLKTVEAKFTVDITSSKKIGNSLIGVFFEDINYAADCSLYAEQIQNRDFEYNIADTKGNDKTWNSNKAWSLKGETAKYVIDSINPIHCNNKHCAKLSIKQAQTALVNKGYLSEYAAHLPERPRTIETALSEALYLTSVERNGDIVSMTSYASLFAKEN